jgi:outer membrane lipoprotein-sorting protein
MLAHPTIDFRQLVVLVLLAPAVGFSDAALVDGRKPAAPPATVDAYVQEFEASYHGARSLRADFTQTYAMEGRTRIESGVACFARGGLMRWDYQHPAQKLFLSDGKHLLLYIPEEKQLTSSTVKSSDDIRVPFELLLSRVNLRRVFARIEFADASLPHDATDRVLRAYPKKEYAEDYKDVLIELDPQFDIRRLVVEYPDDSRMEFQFDHIERNPSLPLSLFRFIPPPDTQVIDQH